MGSESTIIYSSRLQFSAKPRALGSTLATKRPFFYKNMVEGMEELERKMSHGFQIAQSRSYFWLLDCKIQIQNDFQIVQSIRHF